MFDPGETFFLGGCDDLAVTQQNGRAVMEVG